MEQERDIETLIQTLSGYMRKKLLANQHKPHWRTHTDGHLESRLLEEEYELYEAILKKDDEGAWLEAADVAIFAAFRADKLAHEKK